MKMSWLKMGLKIYIMVNPNWGSQVTQAITSSKGKMTKNHGFFHIPKPSILKLGNQIHIKNLHKGDKPQTRRK